jgi:hypothetical protein
VFEFVFGIGLEYMKFPTASTKPRFENTKLSRRRKPYYCRNHRQLSDCICAAWNLIELLDDDKLSRKLDSHIHESTTTVVPRALEICSIEPGSIPFPSPNSISTYSVSSSNEK